MANSLVGDIIDIEFTDDHTASTPTWNLVGQTTDTVEIDSGIETADNRIHGQFSRVVNAVSELWDIGFSAHVVTGTAQLETMGLIDTSTYELKAYSDSRELSASNPAVRITAYATEADKSSGTVKWDLATDDYLITAGTASLNVEDYSTRDISLFSRIRPIRLDEGGSL